MWNTTKGEPWNKQELRRLLARSGVLVENGSQNVLVMGIYPRMQNNADEVPGFARMFASFAIRSS